MIFRRAFIAMCAGLALSVAACGDDSTGSSDEPEFAGTFQLHTVNGTQVPATFGSLRFNDGRLILNANRTWSVQVNYQATQGTTVTPLSFANSGTLEVTGSALRLTSSANGEQFTGSMIGNDRTVTFSGFVYVFRR